jgi:hypothetical protein
MRKFVVKVFNNYNKNGEENYIYNIISAHNEYSCRAVCKDKEITFIFEVSELIYHWTPYEIGLFYAWIDEEKCYLPLDHEEVINEYLANNGENRKNWLLKYAKIFNDSMDDIYTFKQYNKCIDLMDKIPNIKKNRYE